MPPCLVAASRCGHLALLALAILPFGCTTEETEDGDRVAMAPETVTPTSTSEALEAPGIDLGAVVQRVHFAFRPDADGEGWAGAHSTYRVETNARTILVTPHFPGDPRGGVPGRDGAPLSLRTASLRRGDQSLLEPSGRAERAADSGVVWRGDAVDEHLRNRDEGLEQSWRSPKAPAGRGDLEVRISASGLEYTGVTERGLHFEQPGGGGLCYGHATWIDGAGALHALPARFDPERSEIVLTAANDVVERSVFPVLLDPIVSPERSVDEAVVGAQSIDEDTATGALAFTVSDVETAAGDLVVTASADDSSLLPSANIVLGGAAAERTLTLTPAANQHGSTLVTVTVDDGTETASDQFVLAVVSVNDAPVAAEDNYSLNEDTTLSVAAPGVLANDADVDGDSLGALVAADVSQGTLTLGPDGAVSYTPPADYFGSLTFTYTASDGAASSAPTLVTLNVLGVDDPPVLGALGGPYASGEGELLSLTFTATDPEEDSLTFSSPDAPAGAVLTAGGAFSWTPVWQDAGAHTNTAVVSDGSASDSGTFEVDVAWLDADGDTLPDTWEASVGLDPTTANSDEDWIADAEEVGDDLGHPLNTDGDHAAARCVAGAGARWRRPRPALAPSPCPGPGHESATGCVTIVFFYASLSNYQFFRWAFRR